MVVGVHVHTRFRGEGGEHLIHIHIGRRPRPRLEDVDREVVVELTGDHALGCCLDRRCSLSVQHTKLGIGLRRTPLHLRQRSDMVSGQASSGDREILDGPLGLRAVLRINGHPHLAHRVMFDAVLGFLAHHFSTGGLIRDASSIPPVSHHGCTRPHVPPEVASRRPEWPLKNAQKQPLHSNVCSTTVEFMTHRWR